MSGLEQKLTLMVTGANGQVGWELQRLVSNSNVTMHALSHDQLDITDRRAVEETVARLIPDIVINAAAYTAVDRAETERELAFKPGVVEAVLSCPSALLRGDGIGGLCSRRCCACCSLADYPMSCSNPMCFYGLALVGAFEGAIRPPPFLSV